MQEQGTNHKNDDKEPRDHKENTNIESNDPFFLIERGNALEASENHWAASDFFSRASVALNEQASGMETALALSLSVEKEKVNENDERRKIAELYRAQSVEYLRRARGSLLRALEFERDEDLRRADGGSSAASGSDVQILGYQPLMTLLSQEDLHRRNCIFQRTFALGHVDPSDDDKSAGQSPNKINKTVAVQTDPSDGFHRNSSVTETHKTPPNSNTPHNEPSNDNDLPKHPDPTQLSIEERLALLDSTLPPPPKSNEERLKDLGVYVPSTSSSSSKEDRAALFQEMSQEEQLREIINMAQDEAELMLKDNNTDIPQASKYNDAEEMLRNSGIRVDLPKEHDSDTIDTHPSDQEEQLRDIISKTKTELSQLDDADDDDDQDTRDTNVDEKKLVARIHANAIDELGSDQGEDTIKELTAEELLRNMGIDMNQPHANIYNDSDDIKDDNKQENKGEDSIGNSSNNDTDDGADKDNCVNNDNHDDKDNGDENKGDDNHGNDHCGDDNKTDDSDGDSEGNNPKDLKNVQ